MTKHRRAAKIDANQPEIVSVLRSIPGVMVEVSHDDIIVGYKKRNFWYELKDADCVSKKTGLILDSAKKPKQIQLENYWTGHYKIVSTVDEILSDMGMIIVKIPL